MIVITIVSGIVLCVLIFCICAYKQKELEYKKTENEYAGNAIEKQTELDIAKEKTKQILLDKEKEAEITKQLEIKSSFQKENGFRLY